MNSYPVKINKRIKGLKTLIYGLFFLLLVGFWLLYLLSDVLFLLQPSRNIELVGLFVLGVVIWLILIYLRQNVAGVLHISSQFISIESKKRCDIIHYKELKRITFIITPFGPKPYRLEFIYPDFKFKRVRLKDKEQFDAVMEKCYEMAPGGFEIEGSAIQSVNF